MLESGLKQVGVADDPVILDLAFPPVQRHLFQPGAMAALAMRGSSLCFWRENASASAAFSPRKSPTSRSRQ
jgi:hypothetical protein